MELLSARWVTSSSLVRIAMIDDFAVRISCPLSDLRNRPCCGSSCGFKCFRHPHEWQESRNARTKATAGEILRLESALWTFVDIEGIEPTNNFAEQGIRPAVMWRRVSFGTNSTGGSRYVERMLTAIATLRQQRRGVYEYLCDTVQASFEGRQPPSLLPQGRLNP